MTKRTRKKVPKALRNYPGMIHGTKDFTNPDYYISPPRKKKRTSGSPKHSAPASSSAETPNPDTVTDPSGTRRAPTRRRRADLGATAAPAITPTFGAPIDPVQNNHSAPGQDEQLAHLEASGPAPPSDTVPTFLPQIDPDASTSSCSALSATLPPQGVELGDTLPLDVDEQLFFSLYFDYEQWLQGAPVTNGADFTVGDLDYEAVDWFGHSRINPSRMR